MKEVKRHSPLRPAWFFDSARNGGILADIASHRVDRFIYFTGSDDAEVTASAVANYANPDRPDLEDFGELLLRSDRASGYIRVDWYTPDGLQTWDDGRLMILGTEGYIELRKYIDIAGRPGTDHPFLVTNAEMRYVDCVGAPLPYYERLLSDVLDRTETAMPQAHRLRVCSWRCGRKLRRSGWRQRRAGTDGHAKRIPGRHRRLRDRPPAR